MAAEGSAPKGNHRDDHETGVAGDVLILSNLVPHQRRVEAFASDGESLLYSAMRDEASALNRTATEIWELCDGTKTVGAIARELGLRYGVEESYLLADVLAAVTTLQARGLVDLSGSGDDPR